MYTTLKDIYQANANLKGVIIPTPLQESQTFSKLTGANIYLKPENLQKTGSFKIRGAYNKIANLVINERTKGVVAFSAGNHGAGVAYAAQKLNINAIVVMPGNPVIGKKRAIEQYGTKALEYGKNSIEMYQKAVELVEKEGRVMIHPYDDNLIIAGQGTIGLEILDELPEVDTVIIPVSGGGLISGVATALKEIKPTIKVIGVNAKGATAMFTSLKHGKPTEVDKVDTIADGLMCKKPGDLTYAHTERYVDDLVLVSEEEIANTVSLLAERAKLVVEPSGAVALAGALSGQLNIRGENVVVLATGGNISLELYQKLIGEYYERNYNKKVI